MADPAAAAAMHGVEMFSEPPDAPPEPPEEAEEGEAGEDEGVQAAQELLHYGGAAAAEAAAPAGAPGGVWQTMKPGSNNFAFMKVLASPNAQREGLRQWRMGELCTAATALAGREITRDTTSAALRKVFRARGLAVSSLVGPKVSVWSLTEAGLRLAQDKQMLSNEEIDPGVHKWGEGYPKAKKPKTEAPAEGEPPVEKRKPGRPPKVKPPPAPAAAPAFAPYPPTCAACLVPADTPVMQLDTMSGNCRIAQAADGSGYMMICWGPGSFDSAGAAAHVAAISAANAAAAVARYEEEHLGVGEAGGELEEDQF